MAIRMIRKPSDVPNIQNTDDFIPIRYAYGNQDGYIVGRGRELYPEINGNQIKICSGRVVLQGVESDIDESGEIITVDIVSEKRYYVVYYEVDLNNDTASIKATYSTNGFPTLQPSDNLTAKLKGNARLSLYKFIVQNGVVQLESQDVKAVKLGNASQINSVDIHKYYDILLSDDDIIPRYRKVWSGYASVVGGIATLVPLQNGKRYIFDIETPQFGRLKINAQVSQSGDGSGFTDVYIDTITGRNKENPIGNDTSSMLAAKCRYQSLNKNLEFVEMWAVNVRRILSTGQDEISCSPITSCILYAVYEIVESFSI